MNSLQEVTEPQKLFKIKQQVQSCFYPPNPSIAYQLYRAWEYSSNYEDGPEMYQVEIVDNIGRSYRGMLDALQGLIYLDINSILGLVQDRIDGAIHTYNAGHWPVPFRGV